jgi:hypothetical protein
MQAVVHFLQGRRADQELHVGACVAIEVDHDPKAERTGLERRDLARDP